jgi:hypothetical protein
MLGFVPHPNLRALNHQNRWAITAELGIRSEHEQRLGKALCHQQTVERVFVVLEKRQGDQPHDMGRLNLQPAEAVGWNLGGSPGDVCVELADSGLNRHLPQRRLADEDCSARLASAPYGLRGQGTVAIQPPENQLCVEEQPHPARPSKAASRSYGKGALKSSAIWICPFMLPGSRTVVAVGT